MTEAERKALHAEWQDFGARARIALAELRAAGIDGRDAIRLIAATLSLNGKAPE